MFKKKLLLLVIGFFSLKYSSESFPTFTGSFEDILQRLIFNPFQFLGSVVLFIIGFLAIARVIKTIVEQKALRKNTKVHLILIGLMFLIFLYIALKSIALAFVAIVLSLFYGIMDANIYKNRF